ncbi:tRNA methyltransferase 10 homolog A-like [Clavelina lepadiformis]|uniref:tRNA methyltransferase 10 homolog A-like n=1 Tax=Clavelina lepadiformis TaxID=159417 RepID=UPI0040425BFE
MNEEQNGVYQHNYKEMNLEDLKKLLESCEISKNQKKKILKQIKWIESADSRRELRKKRKQRYKEMTKQSIKDGTYSKRQKLEKITTRDNFDELHHIAVDLSFDKLMTNKDLRKLGKQLGWCYKENRRSQHPVQFHICGLQDRMRSHLDPSSTNWDVHFDGNVFESFPKEKLTYLTAESGNVLEELQHGMVYVIGGLVDHNHKKGVCHNLAEENKISTARLPLAENVDLQGRKVLTVNHVFEIILAFCECRNWRDAVLKILPPKKLSSNDVTSKTNENHCDEVQKSLEHVDEDFSNKLLTKDLP